MYLLLTIAFLVSAFLVLQVHSNIEHHPLLILDDQGEKEGDKFVGEDGEDEEVTPPPTFWTKNHLLIIAVRGRETVTVFESVKDRSY